jgi:DNA-binding HxlR family transcriptional regulator
MAEELPIANSTLSQHLKVLKEAGLIQGEIIPPKIKYCINRENWNLAKGLLMGFFG